MGSGAAAGEDEEPLQGGVRGRKEGPPWLTRRPCGRPGEQVGCPRAGVGKPRCGTWREWREGSGSGTQGIAVVLGFLFPCWPHSVFLLSAFKR